MTKCLCTGMVYDPEAVARQQELARKAGKSASSGLFKHVRHVVSSMLAVRGRATSRSTMKNIANL